MTVHATWRQSGRLDFSAKDLPIVGSINGVLAVLDTAGSPGAMVLSESLTMRGFSSISVVSLA